MSIPHESAFFSKLLGHAVTYAGNGSVGLKLYDKGLVKTGYLDQRGEAYTSPIEMITTKVKVIFIAACETADTFKSLWDIMEGTSGRALVLPHATTITGVNLIQAINAWTVIAKALSNLDSSGHPKNVHDAVAAGNTWLHEHNYSLYFDVIGGDEGRNVRIR